jgi:hypothetical protein
VSITPLKSSIVCTHELRPGTTVCWHCRHTVRIAARARRRRLLLRLSAAGIVLVTLGAAGALSASAIRGHTVLRRPRAFTVASKGKAAGADSVARKASAPTMPAGITPAPIPIAPAVVEQAGAVHTGAPFLPIVPLGTTTLRDGPTVTRADSEVTLSFDMPMIRTRIPAKFEHLVRTTLPAIYGNAVDGVLSKLADGDIARQGDLLSELPTRGVRIPVNAAWMIALYPEVRPGHDGPLVVRYRVSVVARSE